MLCYVNLCYEMLYSMCFWDLFTFYTPNIHVKICIKKGKGFKSEGFQVRVKIFLLEGGLFYFLLASWCALVHSERSFFSYSETQTDDKG